MFDVVGIKEVGVDCEIDRVEVNIEFNSRRRGEEVELLTFIPKVIKGAN